MYQNLHIVLFKKLHVVQGLVATFYSGSQITTRPLFVMLDWVLDKLGVSLFFVNALYFIDFLQVSDVLENAFGLI